MKKAWRIVVVIVLVAVLLGAMGVGVGLMTGADGARIYSVLDNRYHITMYYEYSQEVMNILMQELA